MSRLAAFSYRRRWYVLAAWIVAFVGLLLAGRAAGGSYATNFSIPSSESQRAYNLLQNRFPTQAGDTVQVVEKVDRGVNDPSARAQFEGLLGKLARQPHVTGVVSPYGAGGTRQVSRDGRTAYATVQFDVRASGVPHSVSAAMLKDVNAASRPGFTVAAGGQIISAAQSPSLSSEYVGMGAAAVVLLIVFGSVLAMGLPIITALTGIGIGFTLIKLLTAVVQTPNFASQIATMIGLGVGIDYALFIVTRYRQGLADGQEPEEAVASAMGTAGRAVVFAGCTVIISLLGMLLINLSVIRGMALAAGSVVLATLLAAVTLLPAILGFTGRSIDRLRVPGVRSSTQRRGFWWRWSRYVQERPIRLMVIGLVVVLVAAVPLLKMRVGSPDAGSDPASYTTHKSYTMLSQGFGPGYNGPFVLAVQLPGGANTAVLSRIVADVQATPGVASVSPPQLSPSGTAAVIQAIPTTSPQAAATGSLLHRLRGQVIPQAVAGTGVRVDVGGSTATAADISRGLSSQLPLFIGAVVLLSFILLMLVFRSVLIPLSAAILNLLSVGASYGVIVAVFQWGWGKGLIGLSQSSPINFYLPIMMFAILFGLSMDYEVFLMSRIREEYLHNGQDNGAAVADGLAGTARVITAAALIMIVVFVSFVASPNAGVKNFGLGMAAAILVDATVIRMVILPATMELFGKANWWLPRWLQRLPEVQLDVPDRPALHEAA
jgi:RND superfamily putative drug exporter